MLPRRIASRYAEALFGLAQHEQKTEMWERELATLAELIARMPELQALLTHPEIPLPRKQGVIARAFGGKIADPVLAVLMLLLKRGHDPDIETVHAIFVERWDTARTIVPVTVTSATPLTDPQVQALTASLARRTGGTIQLARAVDPALIAGMVVQIGDHVIDASAKTALDDLREAMRG